MGIFRAGVNEFWKWSSLFNCIRSSISGKSSEKKLPYKGDSGRKFQKEGIWFSISLEKLWAPICICFKNITFCDYARKVRQERGIKTCTKGCVAFTVSHLQFLFLVDTAWFTSQTESSHPNGEQFFCAWLCWRFGQCGEETQHNCHGLYTWTDLSGEDESSWHDYRICCQRIKSVLDHLKWMLNTLQSTA